jgi:hypothetical protein
MIGDELNERKERIVDRIDRTRAQPEVLRETAQMWTESAAMMPEA